MSRLVFLRDCIRNADGLTVDWQLEHAIADLPRTYPEAFYPEPPGGPSHLHVAIPRHMRSLDQSIELTERALPGCHIALADVGSRHTAHIKWEGLEAAAYGNTRPLAILDCLLSVLIEKEKA